MGALLGQRGAKGHGREGLSAPDTLRGAPRPAPSPGEHLSTCRRASSSARALPGPQVCTQLQSCPRRPAGAQGLCSLGLVKGSVLQASPRGPSASASRFQRPRDRQKALFLLLRGVQTQAIGLGAPTLTPRGLASLGAGQTVFQPPTSRKTRPCSVHPAETACFTPVRPWSAQGWRTGLQHCVLEFAGVDREKCFRPSWGSGVRGCLGGSKAWGGRR